MHRVSAFIKIGWFFCTQRGALNLDAAALKHYEAALARIKPLIDSGKVEEAKKSMYIDLTDHDGTRKLSLFAVKEFAWNSRLQEPEALRNFLNRLPYDPRALEKDKIIKEMQSKNTDLKS